MTGLKLHLLFSYAKKKYKHNYSKILLIGLIFLSTTFKLSAQSYDYPIKPGSDKWKRFKTHDEMIDSTQIPNSILSEMSTKNLIESCLNYPLALEFLAFPNYKVGYQSTFKKFSGYSELILRSDVGKIFLPYIHSLDINSIKNQSSQSDKGRFVYNSSLIELMITDSIVLSTLNQIELNNLLKELRKRLEIKIKYSEYYGNFGIYISAYSLSQVLMQMNIINTTTDKDILLFAKEMQLLDPKVLNSIVYIVDTLP